MPRSIIELTPDEWVEGEFEIIGEKITLKQCRRPGSVELIEYRRQSAVGYAGRQVRPSTAVVPAAPAHEGRWCHLSSSALTAWCKCAIALLEPIYDAQMKSVLRLKVLAMEEAPIKAGKKSPGKLKRGVCWPIYADARQDITHAEYWTHTRKTFERASSAEAKACTEALALIGHLYDQERVIRKKNLTDQAKLDHRTQHSLPIVKAFWSWCDDQLCRHLEPSNLLSRAISYAMNRTVALQKFLSDLQVAVDTIHLERLLQPIPMEERTGSSAGLS